MSSRDVYKRQLQGRLDYMQRDMSSFIEMKSGKADEYAIRGKVEPKENNKVQMLLYQAVLQYSMGMDHRKVKAYLLYTCLLYTSYKRNTEDIIHIQIAVSNHSMIFFLCHLADIKRALDILAAPCNLTGCQHRLCHTITDQLVISIIDHHIAIFKECQLLHTFLLQ